VVSGFLQKSGQLLFGSRFRQTSKTFFDNQGVVVPGCEKILVMSIELSDQTFNPVSDNCCSNFTTGGNTDPGMRLLIGPAEEYQVR
jgi:hypothetical protein